jgi:pteridine reductase
MGHGLPGLIAGQILGEPGTPADVLDEEGHLAHHGLVSERYHFPEAPAGKVALVTGASRRVGRAIATELCASGFSVAVHHHASGDEARALCEELGQRGGAARAFAADLRDPAASGALIDDVLAWQGRLEVLVNNAAVFQRVPLLDGDDATWEQAWQEALSLNLLAPARLVRKAAPALRRAGGVVVSITDIAAEQAWPNYAHYGAAKAGLSWLVRAAAVALAPEARSVGVAPGIAEFPQDFGQDARQKLVGKVPLKRAGTPEDIARAVAYLVSATYVTGTVLVVDGGRLVASGEGGA